MTDPRNAAIYVTTAEATPVLVGQPVVAAEVNGKKYYTYRQVAVLPKGTEVTVAQMTTMQFKNSTQMVAILSTGEFIIAQNTLARKIGTESEPQNITVSSSSKPPSTKKISVAPIILLAVGILLLKKLSKKND